MLITIVRSDSSDIEIVTKIVRVVHTRIHPLSCEYMRDRSVLSRVLNEPALAECV